MLYGPVDVGERKNIRRADRFITDFQSFTSREARTLGERGAGPDAEGLVLTKAGVRLVPDE